VSQDQLTPAVGESREWTLNVRVRLEICHNGTQTATANASDTLTMTIQRKRGSIAANIGGTATTGVTTATPTT